MPSAPIQIASWERISFILRNNQLIPSYLAITAILNLPTISAYLGDITPRAGARLVQPDSALAGLSAFPQPGFWFVLGLAVYFFSYLVYMFACPHLLLVYKTKHEFAVAATSPHAQSRRRGGTASHPERRLKEWRLANVWAPHLRLALAISLLFFATCFAFSTIGFLLALQ